MKRIAITRRDGICISHRWYTPAEYIKADLLQPARLKTNMTANNQRRKSEKTYQNIMAFDIETSTLKDGDQYRTWLYHWQMCIDGIIIFGRTWKEWFNILKYIHDKLNLSADHKAIIYIHNMAYEMSFLYFRLPLGEDAIFATDTNRPIKVRCNDYLEGIEFRCTYTMTNKSLEKLSIDTLSCPYIKDKADIDHTITRTQKTQLTGQEQKYCAVDVLVIYHYIKDLLKTEYNLFDIPITSTGFVRRACKREVKHNKEWQKFRKTQRLTAEMFWLYNKGFRGGDTHSYAAYNGVIVEGDGEDITSSYPTRIMLDEFPASPAEVIHDVTAEQFKTLQRNNWLWVGHIYIKDVHCKGFDYIPLSKCTGISQNRRIDNGRVHDAEMLSIVVTSVDYEIIKDNYSFVLVEIPSLLYHVKKALLPACFRNFCYSFYKQKTELKGVEGEEQEYMRQKELLNSIYGMSVTNPLHDEYKIIGKEWITKRLNIDNWESRQEEYEKMINGRNNFLPYTIGVWITAYSRKDLHEALKLCGMDAIYWDTDSVKFTNREEHLKDFEFLNQKKLARIREIYGEGGLSPKDIYGKEHTIGLWDMEYKDGINIKVFGAKKYFYRDRATGKEVVTVAGLNKKKAAAYLQQKYGSVLNVELGEVFDENCSGRTYAIYSFEPFTMYVDGVRVHEESYISIVPTTYKLSETEEYKLFIAMTKAKMGNTDLEINEEKLYEKVVLI